MINWLVRFFTTVALVVGVVGCSSESDESSGKGDVCDEVAAHMQEDCRAMTSNQRKQFICMQRVRARCATDECLEQGRRVCFR